MRTRWFGNACALSIPILRAPKLMLIPEGWPGRTWSIRGSTRPPPTQNSTRKGGGLTPPPFPLVFAVGGGRLDPRNRRFPARPAPGDKDKFWSCQFIWSSSRRSAQQAAAAPAALTWTAAAEAAAATMAATGTAAVTTAAVGRLSDPQRRPLSTPSATD